MYKENEAGNWREGGRQAGNVGEERKVGSLAAGGNPCCEMAPTVNGPCCENGPCCATAPVVTAVKRVTQAGTEEAGGRQESRWAGSSGRGKPRCKATAIVKKLLENPMLRDNFAWQRSWHTLRPPLPSIITRLVASLLACSPC